VRDRGLARLLVLGVLLSGCGGEVTEAPDPIPRGDARGPAVAPAAGGTAKRDPLARAAANRPTITITVDDGSGAGGAIYRTRRTVRGGLVEIRLRNRGDVPHKAQLWRITGDHSVTEALRISHPQPEWLRTAGGVSVTAPRSTSRTLQSLPAGRYYVAGTLDEPGRVASFEVTAPDGAPPPPRAPARIEAIDYSFRVSGLRAGRNSVDFDNTGAAPHHAFLVPMRADATLAEVKRFFNTTSSTGPPPVDAEGTRETVVLEGGERQVTELELVAARYALICLVRSRDGGPRHVELGMINEVTVR